ncbi:unnamed protein product [Macrosiphum euphorbiae]|uniref:Uncharacterized protein n=1 Tax=Macrosiphum euphorbiae TaxID=13131 RepID=A0AAV0WL24_9HEMI|nr:unnamed protein product [Macrosiphum euphorbiae]
MSSLAKKQKLMLNLLLLQEADEEHAIIKHVILCDAEKNKTHDMFLARKTEGFFSILIEKHLWRDEKKFREFFRVSCDQFHYILNIIEEDFKTSPSIKIPEPITAAEKLAITLRYL